MHEKDGRADNKETIEARVDELETRAQVHFTELKTQNDKAAEREVTNKAIFDSYKSIIEGLIARVEHLERLERENWDTAANDRHRIEQMIPPTREHPVAAAPPHQGS